MVRIWILRLLYGVGRLRFVRLRVRASACVLSMRRTDMERWWTVLDAMYLSAHIGRRMTA